MGGGPSVTYNPPPPDDSFAKYLQYTKEKEAAAEARAERERTQREQQAAARKASGISSYAGMRKGVESQLRAGLLNYGEATSQLRDYASKYDLNASDLTNWSNYRSQNKDIQDLITEGRKQGETKGAAWGDEAGWVQAANQQYGRKATDLSEFSEDELAKLHYDLYGKNEERAGTGSVEGDINNLTKIDRKSTRLNSSHVSESRMPSSA
mgnify:CR=1 FL=1